MTTTEQAPAQAGIGGEEETHVSMDELPAYIASLQEQNAALVSRLAELDARTCAFCSDLDVAHISVAGNHWCPSRAAEVLAATPEGPRHE